MVLLSKLWPELKVHQQKFAKIRRYCVSGPRDTISDCSDRSLLMVYIMTRKKNYKSKEQVGPFDYPLILGMA